MERPSEIDGDPATVQREVISNLETQIEELREYIEEANVQFRNSYMSRRLKESPSMTPSELARKWHASDANAGCERLLTLTSVLNNAVIGISDAD